MTLRLHYVCTTSLPVEIEGLTPEFVREKTLAEIERTEIFHGRQRLPLAEFFSVRGNATDERLEFSGEMAGVHWLGAQMKRGEIHVLGSAGRHVGSEMRGGAMHVAGNVSDWLGAEMHGGFIHVRGNAGHHVGAAYQGSRCGMTQGTLLVQGNAGNEVGQAMRRGLVAIGGQVGNLFGFNMRAGTLLAFGPCGVRVGAGMRRGTIGLFGYPTPPLLSSFHRACRFSPTVLALVWAELRLNKFQFSPEIPITTLDLYHGDHLEGGRGELLVRTA